MKNDDFEAFDPLVDKLMGSLRPDSPSPDFTGRVMAAVTAETSAKKIVYTPLISGRAWFVIFGGIAAVFAFLIFKNNGASSPQVRLFSVDFGKYLDAFPVIKLSSLTAVVLIAAAVMFFIEIFLLKNYLDKRLRQ